MVSPKETNEVIDRIDKYVVLAYAAMIGIALSAVFLPIPVYAHMIFTTLLIIYIGSVTSVSDLEEELESTIAQRPTTKSGKRGNVEKMNTKDAYMFPVIGSVALFSLYIVFKLFPKEYVNLVVKIYFGFFGVVVLGTKLSELLTGILPLSVVSSLRALNVSVKVPNFEFYYNKLFGFFYSFGAIGKPPPHDSNAKSSDHKVITAVDGLAFLLSIAIGALHLQYNHWTSNNAFGIAFSLQAIELISLGSYFNGFILLSGLFVYDIFWVFGTDVMVTVAKSFDAPIKLLFPQPDGSPPSLLGLGDIVIPGIFISLMLRFDYHLLLKASQKQAEKIYFWTVLFAYFIGLTVTVLVMYVFKAAQPALLYLVPACLGSSSGLAAYRGEFLLLFKFDEEKSEKEAEGKEKDKEKDKIKDPEKPVKEKDKVKDLEKQVKPAKEKGEGRSSGEGSAGKQKKKKK